MQLNLSLILGRANGVPQLPNLDELILYTRGTVGYIGTSSYLTSRYPPNANHEVAQARGVSVLGDGTGFGLVTGILTTDDITVGTGSGVPTITINGRLDIAIGVNVWGVQIHRAGVLIAHLQMMCGTSSIHPTVELSATPGLPNCGWSGFAAGIYAEATDGSGYDRNPLGWTIADGSTMYQEVSHTNLILANSFIPPGAGFDINGDALVTQYPGPISPDQKVVGVPCLLGDGTGWAAITGLLTTDVITVPAGVSQPTCTINGRMDFVNTEKPYWITVTRSSVLWDFYPCEGGTGTLLEGIVGGNNGTLKDFIADPWSTRDDGRSQQVEFGFSVDRVIEPELWVDPTPQTIDVNNYSTYDAETGIGRIVSDGPLVLLPVDIVGLSGDIVSYTIEILSAIGSIEIAYVNGTGYVPPIEFDETGIENGIFTSESEGVSIKRAFGASADVTFKLSVKQVIPGISCCNDTYLHQDGTAPEFPAGDFSNALNAEVLLEGALGPRTQSVALWTGEAQVDLSTLPANTADQTFVGDDGMVITDTAQDAEAIAKIVKVIGPL